MFIVFVGGDAVFRKWLVETWPTASGFVFRVRAEQFLPTTNARVCPRRLSRVVFSRECPLGAALPGDLVLLVGKVGWVGFAFHGQSLPDQFRSQGLFLNALRGAKFGPSSLTPGERGCGR